MTCLCDPCARYYPNSDEPTEAACTSCSHLDDPYPCAELCRRFRLLEGKEVSRSASSQCTDVSGESGGEGGSKS